MGRIMDLLRFLECRDKSRADRRFARRLAAARSTLVLQREYQANSSATVGPLHVATLRSYTALAFASLPDSRPAENQIDGRACRLDSMHEFERMWYAGKADSADVVGPQETVPGKAGVIFGVAYVGRGAVLQNRARPGTLGGGTLRL